MSWKRNAISYPIWLIYVFVVGFGVFQAVDIIGQNNGLSLIACVGVCVAYFAVCGILTLLLHGLMKDYETINTEKKKSLNTFWTVLEALTAVAFLVIGLLLRIQAMQNVADSSDYYQVAAVSTDSSIPQIVHGAVYVYIKLLQAILFFLGNSYNVAIWVQLLLNIGAIIMLYFGLKEATGRISALVVLGFLCLSPTVINSALEVTPLQLYLFFFAIAFAVIGADSDNKLNPAAYFVSGVFAAAISYFDVSGFLLVLFCFAVMCKKRRIENKFKSYALASLSIIVGVAAGYAACVGLDAFLSNKSFINVALALFNDYIPNQVGWSVYTISDVVVIDYYIMFGIMTLGIFSFWCNKSDKLKTWIVALAVVLACTGFGLFSDVIPGSVFIYVVCAILAGVAVENCFAIKNSADAVIKNTKESSDVTEMEADEEGASDEGKENAVDSHIEPESEVKEDLSAEENVTEEIDERTEEVEEVTEIVTEVTPEEVAEEIEVEEVVDVEEAEVEEATDVEEIEETEEVSEIEEIEEGDEGEKSAKKEIEYIENPLPLPKKHEKRTLDFAVKNDGEDDFDLDVSDDEDFDI